MSIKPRPILELLDVNDVITKKAFMLKEENKDNDIFNEKINILLLFDEAKDISEPKQEINIDDLESGKYQTVKSNSDKNISKSIKFIINNLTSFKKI